MQQQNNEKEVEFHPPWKCLSLEIFDRYSLFVPNILLSLMLLLLLLLRLCESGSLQRLHSLKLHKTCLTWCYILLLRVNNVLYATTSKLLLAHANIRLRDMSPVLLCAISSSHWYSRFISKGMLALQYCILFLNTSWLECYLVLE